MSIASTSTMMVCSEDRVAYVHPSTFLSVALVNPIRCFQNPPYQGARFGINFQTTLFLFKVSDSSGELNSISSSSAAVVEALSDIRILGKELWLLNLLDACKKVSTVKSVTTSRCKALITAHVKRQIYTFFSSLPFCTYSAPVKSTPVYSNS